MRLLGKSDRIMGIDIPRRRFTGRAVLYFVIFFCVPLLLLCAALDALLHIALEAAFGICYGLTCWFG